MTDRFVVLGLAGPRAAWFSAVGQWAHAGSLPVDFVKCVSEEQARTRLTSGRVHSAVLLDATLPSVDRDLIEAAHDAGTAVLVVDSRSKQDIWLELGADSLLTDDFGPDDLTEALRAHAAMVPTTEWRAAVSPKEVLPVEVAPLVALCGPGGTGVSTLTMALAQQLGSASARPRVVLADMCLRAEQGVLHDAGDLGPGVQELVDLCRTATPTVDQARAFTYDVTERGYALLLGLRRSASWSTLRPRAVAAALDALRRAFSIVVCDCDADLESQAQGGSLDVEERHSLARAAVTNADVVFAVGTGGLKGVYSLARVVNELIDAGVSPTRVVPVFNRVGRAPRQRSSLTAALAGLLDDAARGEMALAVFLPDRDIEHALHDRARLPPALGDPLLGAFLAINKRGSRAGQYLESHARPVRPRELAAWPEAVSTP